MKLFHFYIDSDEEQYNGYSHLLFPYCRNKEGYGIFWYGIDNAGFIKAVDYRGKNIHAYFENGADSIKNFDNNLGRHGKNKLQELNQEQYIIATIKQIFENEDIQETMKMWDKA